MSIVRMDWRWYGMPATEKGGFVSYEDYSKTIDKLHNVAAKLITAEAENAKLKEAALLYSSDMGHSHACKATSKTVGVCICGYDALAALLGGEK